MLFYVSVKSLQSGFLGACVVNAQDELGAQRQAATIAGKAGHHCTLETLSHPIPAGEIPLPPVGRLLSYEELEAHFRAHGGLLEIKTSRD